MMHTRHKHKKYMHDETLIFHIHEHPQFHASQYTQNHNIHHIHHIIYTNILQHSKTKNTNFNNGRYITNISTDPYTVTVTYIKTNMCHIHTSIVSRHIGPRGNNKILRTPPPHILAQKKYLSASLVPLSNS